MMITDHFIDQAYAERNTEGLEERTWEQALAPRFLTMFSIIMMMMMVMMMVIVVMMMTTTTMAMTMTWEQTLAPIS